jgi:hypothetical protein
LRHGGALRQFDRIADDRICSTQSPARAYRLVAGRARQCSRTSAAFIDESPVDHTWVTSYDNRTQNFADIAAVIAANQDCWFCWGDYHAKGGTPSNPRGFLGSESGDLNVARCLVQPNADCSSTYAARGTIFTYGVDGVCHQFANQVLYSTRAGGA